ncbi:MAG: alpha/beta fold hydrolase [Chloroflexi bacterium]|nr:alpha/beta fold hydrolase [Chloroflexota bacterium]
MIVLLVGVLVGVAGALLAWLLAAFYLAELLTRTKRWRVEGNPADLRLRHEEIEFFAADGACIRGWYMESPGARATVVVVHDAQGTRSDPSQGLLDLQRDYLRRGINVLSFDLRGRGESEGDDDHLGAAELTDVEAAVGYARNRSAHAPLFLHGFGMGAALALIVAAREPAISGVIADSPFVSMRSHVRHEYQQWPEFVFWLATWLARRFLHADVDAITPIDVIPQLRQPVLYIHAEDDPEVPVEHTLNLGAASLNAGDGIWISPAGGHCQAYLDDSATYLARCIAHIDSVVSPRRPLARAL